ncbi:MULTISPECIES: flavodoxin [Sporomusaceae]|uniref:flavodoxin n=1 Tax=Sporomusaceae TaxID=1843490 RepID=UPI00036BD0F8|nr:MULTISPECIES: flavodoxin [Sporomusaceae]
MKKIAVIYWSGTGNTQAMAQAVADGAKHDGADVVLLEASAASAADVATADAVAFGCPSMGAEELEETIMEPLVAECESALSGKSLALFGSYGWGNGEWMQEWESRMQKAGAQIVAEGLIVNGAPDATSLAQCEALGRQLR